MGKDCFGDRTLTVKDGFWASLPIALWRLPLPSFLGIFEFCVQKYFPFNFLNHKNKFLFQFQFAGCIPNNDIQVNPLLTKHFTLLFLLSFMFILIDDAYVRTICKTASSKTNSVEAAVLACCGMYNHIIYHIQ